MNVKFTEYMCNIGDYEKAVHKKVDCFFVYPYN